MRWFKLVALEDRARERSERERRESGVLELSSYTKQNSIITPANIYTQPSTTFVTVIADTIQTNMVGSRYVGKLVTSGEKDVLYY